MQPQLYQIHYHLSFQNDVASVTPVTFTPTGRVGASCPFLIINVVYMNSRHEIMFLGIYQVSYAMMTMPGPPFPV